MTLLNFEKELTQLQVKKGSEYFKVGYVRNLKETKPGNWKAIVTGTKNYNVKILLQKNKITDCNCSCPHNEVFCKHVVAALYSLKEKKSIKEKKGRQPKKQLKVKGSKKDYASIIRRIIDADDKRAVFYKNRYNSEMLFSQLGTLLQNAKKDITGKKYEQGVNMAFAMIENIHPMLENTDDSRDTASEYVQKAFNLLLKVCKTKIPLSLREYIIENALGEMKNDDYEGYGFDEEWRKLVITATSTIKNREQILRNNNIEIDKMPKKSVGKLKVFKKYRAICKECSWASYVSYPTKILAKAFGAEKHGRFFRHAMEVEFLGTIKLPVNRL